jgi:thioredoxin 1
MRNTPYDQAMFLTINSIPELREFINSNRAVIMYFSHEHCSVCKVLKPKLDEALTEAYPEIKNVYIDIKHNPQFSDEYQVNSVPVVLLYLEGREFIRKTRTFSVKEIIDQIERPYRLMIE